MVSALRENISCKSIIITYNKDVHITLVVEKIQSLFKNTIKQSISASQAVCGVDTDCSNCSIKADSNPLSFKRKLFRVWSFDWV